MDDVPTLPVVQPGGENPTGFTVVDDVGHETAALLAEIPPPPWA